MSFFKNLTKSVMPLADPFDLLGTQQEEFKGDPSDGYDAKTEAILQQIIDGYDGIENPTFDTSAPTMYEKAGDLSLTGLNGDYQSQDSRLAGLEQDQRLTGVQSSALQRLSEIADGDGFTAQDKARLDQAQDQVATADRGRREAILQNMATRGMSGSGNELLAQLQSNQAATDRQNDASLNIAAQGNQRALEALMSSSDLARRMDQDRLGLETRKAQAQDAINQFNAGQRLSKDQYNSQVSNRASEANWQNAQNIANANVGLKNDDTRYQNDLKQRGFENSMSKQGGKAAAMGSLGEFYWNKGTAAAKAHATPKPNPMGNLMGLAGAGIGAYFGGPGGASAGYAIGNGLANRNKKYS